MRRWIGVLFAIGSVLFTSAAFLQFRESERPVNLLGCILFMVSAIAGYVVPETGDVLDLAAANWATSLGAVCFLIGALLLVPEPDPPQAAGVSRPP